MSTIDTPAAIDPHALSEILERGEEVKIIDVRTTAEFESVPFTAAAPAGR